MNRVVAMHLVLWLGLPSATALELPWEKEGSKRAPGAGQPAAPEVTAVEFVYRAAMDNLHGRKGKKLCVGDPKIGAKEIRVHIAVAGEGETDLVFVEKENDGKTALVVMGPPDSEGEPYYLVRKDGSWAMVDGDVPAAAKDVGDIDVKIAEVATAFFAALREGDVEKAYAMTSPLYRERVDAKGFRAFLGRWPVFRGHGVAVVTEARNHRGVGLVAAELHVSELMTHKAHLELDDVEGQWRVGVIEVSSAAGDPSATSEQSPAAFLGSVPPPPDPAANAAAKKVMALPEVAEYAKRLKAEPQRYGALSGRVEEEPSEEQRGAYGFCFHGIAVGYDDRELLRFVTWQRFAVDAGTGEIRAYDAAEDTYMPLPSWRESKANGE